MKHWLPCSALLVACATAPSPEAVEDALVRCNYGRSAGIAIEPDEAFITALQARVARERGLSNGARADIETHFVTAFRQTQTEEDAVVAAEQVVTCVDRELRQR